MRGSGCVAAFIAALTLSACGRIGFAATDSSLVADANADAGTGTDPDAAALDDAALGDAMGRDTDASVPPDASGDAGSDAGLPPNAIVQVATGLATTCVRFASGTVDCVGENTDGVLGTGTVGGPSTTRLGAVPGVDDAVDLRAGDFHMCIMRATGSAACWGWNENGALGTGTGTPVDIPSPALVTVFDGAVRFALARTNTCAILGTGELRCVGDNFFGQLGDGTRTSSAAGVTVIGLSGVTDVSGAEGHYCAVHDGGTVSCWGWGMAGQLGDGTMTPSQPTPVTVTGIADALEIGVGHAHSCAIRADRTLWCWGENVSGQLGDGSTISRSAPVLVRGLADVAQVVGGYAHTCALLGDGRIECFGWNGSGELGDSTTMERHTPAPVMAPSDAIQIAADNGGAFTCSLHADHTVRCWGDNYAGAFGDGTMTPSTVPVVMLPPP